MTVAADHAGVRLTITCRTSPDAAAAGTRHPITVHPDGRIDTPHDLAAERIGVALGGYLTCVDLVDRTAPVFREWLALRRRDAGLPIRSRDGGSRWHATQRSSCCRAKGFESPAAAADHARSTEHLSAVRGAEPHLLRLLVDGAQLPQPDRPIGEPWDTLWACGVPPATVEAINADCGLTEPLEPGFYLGVLVHRPARRWLREMLRSRPGSATAEWLAWTYGPTDRSQPQVRAEWLRLGVPARAIVGLLGSDYRPADVEVLAAHWNITNASAALLLLDWRSHGLNLPVSALTGPAISALAYPPRPPGRRALGQLRAELATDAAVADEDLALAIVEHGSVRAARLALQ